MGILDQLALRAAGAAGSFQQGRLKGEAVRYDREQTEKERQAEIERRALEQALLDRREVREAAYDRQRQKLMDAQIADYEAQVSGTGRYAPKQDSTPGRWEKSVDRSGRVRYYNPETNETRETPLTERVGGEGGGTGGPGWQLARTADGKDVRVNVRTGEIKPLETALAGPASRPLTGDERKGAAYLTRAETSMKDLDRVLSSGYQPSMKLEVLGSTARSSPQGKGVLGSVVGSAVSGVANAALGGEDQQFLQAAQNIVNAINRRDSGANITAAEWSDAFQRYLPRYSDDPVTREQKRRALAAEIEGLRFSAGRAMGTSQPGQGSAVEAPSAPSPKRSALSDLNYLRGKP